MSVHLCRTGSKESLLPSVVWNLWKPWMLNSTACCPESVLVFHPDATFRSEAYPMYLASSFVVSFHGRRPLDRLPAELTSTRCSRWWGEGSRSWSGSARREPQTEARSLGDDAGLWSGPSFWASLSRWPSDASFPAFSTWTVFFLRVLEAFWVSLQVDCRRFQRPRGVCQLTTSWREEKNIQNRRTSSEKGCHRRCSTRRRCWMDVRTGVCLRGACKEKSWTPWLWSEELRRCLLFGL